MPQTEESKLGDGEEGVEVDKRRKKEGKVERRRRKRKRCSFICEVEYLELFMCPFWPLWGWDTLWRAKEQKEGGSHPQENGPA